jgi:L-ornithine N5-monooxygenase
MPDFKKESHQPVNSPMTDIVGVGFGPSNIALAICIEEMRPDLTACFVEARESAAWQPGMMVDQANIQNHPCRDFVTPRNPRSRYTFINYLFENGLLFRHLNLGIEAPLRKEYARYIAWVAQHFAHQTCYGAPVTGVEPLRDAAKRAIGWRVRTANGGEHLGRALVVAPGRTPYIPPIFRGLHTRRIYHLNDYIPHTEELAKRGELRQVAVIGASQSAVEILLDLGQRVPGAHVTSYIRHFGFRLKDTSPFMEEAVFPEYVEPYYRATADQRAEIDRDLRYMNYSAADMDVIKSLYLKLYEQDLDGCPRIAVRRNSEIFHVELAGERIRISDKDKYSGTKSTGEFDAVILATGFLDIGRGEMREVVPPLLASIANELRMDEQGSLAVNFDYSLSPRNASFDLAPVFLNGLCEGSHGISDAGSFSLLALRSLRIVQALSETLRPQQQDAI